MSRIFYFLAFVWTLTGIAHAQQFSALARVEPDNSRVTDVDGGIRLDLGLNQGVPYRLFTLEDPYRLVLDFREVDWTGLDRDEFLQSEQIKGVQFGTYVPGWSRMVLELGSPLRIDQAELQINDASGAAFLTMLLKRTSAAQFSEHAGAPHDSNWDLPEPAEVAALPAKRADSSLHVMLDPGHGGIDPGAEVGGTDEKTLMLLFARELRELLLRSGGFEVTLTRSDDHFVSLERRIAMAHRAEADVFISLHADALSEGLAHGATVYTLDDKASDIASSMLAERHDRGDLISGVDLSGTDDQVADVLLDLARQETKPRTNALAQALADGMSQQGGPMNRRAIRKASFSVLKAADIPSVLVELGFLSSPRDLENLQNAEWRMLMAKGIHKGLVQWHTEDLAKRSLIGQ